jgi:hypothetical protein
MNKDNMKKARERAKVEERTLLVVTIDEEGNRNHRRGNKEG